MTIKKTESGWIVDIQPGGRGFKRYRKTFGTKREALEWETWLKGQLQQEPDWQPKKRDTRRLSELLDVWWINHGQQLRAGKNTQSRLLLLINAIGNPTADQFSADDFAAYRAKRLEAGISANAINREHAYLRAMFNELKRLNHWSGENPLSEIRSFKIVEKELTFLTNDQIKLLFAALSESSNPDTLLVSQICLATGARWSEAEGLKPTQLRQGAIEYAVTKSGRNRTIPISAELEAELQQLAKDGRARLFVNCYSAFREAVDRSGLTLPAGQLTHVLRHTFASHFMMNGGNILTLQRVLGHSDLKMTMRYAHLSPEHLQEVRSLNPLARLTLG
ncbi:tyrosine-type recombinase/integrase [Iodobacter sp.]|uniref:phage integrase n=1 Tax=Iodobacter sp. TaxID=1915058 RepID=UPI0025D6FCF8|nr:tyrosine-type recombinase/integrase [Iodobacter sp.]